MIISYDGYLCDTFISDNADFSRNNIPEIVYSVLASLDIVSKKYSIYASTIKYLFNEVLKVTDDKVVIHILISPKSILIMVYPESPFQNNPHDTSLVLCETNVRDFQYKIESDTDR